MTPAAARPGVEPVRLPHTWRPLGVRFAGGISVIALVAVCLAVWYTFSPADRADFTPFQRGTIGFCTLLALALWYGVMRCRVTATEAGLLVVNGYRYHRLEWAEVLRADLRRGAPWATLDLSDGSTVSVVALQTADGARAIKAVRQIRMLIAAHDAG